MEKVISSETWQEQNKKPGLFIVLHIYFTLFTYALISSVLTICTYLHTTKPHNITDEIYFLFQYSVSRMVLVMQSFQFW